MNRKTISSSLLAGAFSVAISSVAINATASAGECNHSKWGKDDEIGAANYVTPERVLAATKLVKKGQSHPLGIVVEPGVTPSFPPRSVSLQIVHPGQQYKNDLREKFGWPMVYNDDLSQIWWGTGPQLNGLGHVGEKGVFYNCNEGKDFSQLTGLTKLGLEKVPPLIGRGVLIDMAKHFGVKNMKAGQHFGPAQIKAAAKAQGVVIREADIVLFHTGWTDAKLKAEPETWISGEPGLSNEGVAYLASLNPMAVGTDSWYIEAIPPAKGNKPFYAFIHFQRETGTYVLETMNTGRLAREGVHEFMFVLGQARIKGTTQMIINPVALW
uniref:Cyclase n=1 Tax=Candidatus Kentrum sp. FM TaxID=2126340 RepID=A0A450TVS5_9GAMM|nr:MAG: Putative cyclase [Candidatus Kentron sp. FM]VFJ73866.1 MAG: Putative cyclase [Candidatus Kentron sp. FM]VFK19028.1 MAG: Putative cyclase [Candidatus Kentron sp. FM]